ncbi:CRE-FBXA-137 protein [Caenorhabditis remanei]|uniref:CRE-FBXA-137 protein n=1 Tax=Caenorhabditis remanei TaxID=31234 RepID=E3LHB2_CAERE|nr:CRE-FBXA-137 protein [Caenorhabditis remanei]
MSPERILAENDLILKEKITNNRLSLQLCSKEDQDVVLKSRFDLKTLAVRGHYDENANFELSRFDITSSVTAPNWRTYSNKKKLMRSSAINEFMRIFRTGSHVQELHLTRGRTMNNFLESLLNQLREEQIVNKKKLKIRVKEICWSGSIYKEYTNFLNFLRYVSPSHLEKITFETHEIPMAVVEELVQTEQFKSLKKVIIFPTINVSLDSFLNLDSMNLTYPTLCPKDGIMLVEKYLKDPLPIDSCFNINSEQKLPESFKERLFDLMGLPNTVDARKSISRNRDFHIMKFDVNADTVFLLKIDEFSIFGVIVSKNFINGWRKDLAVFVCLRIDGYDFYGS